jgi:branched-chain amino acid transport system permease protein
MLLKRLYGLDPLYGLLLTFGLALILEGVFRRQYGVSGQSYNVPELLPAPPTSASWSCPTTGPGSWWPRSCLPGHLVPDRAHPPGAYLRAGTENAKLVQAFGVNVPLMVMLTYGAGAALAGLAGVLAAPVIQVNPLMGSNLIIVVFAVVVIGGMGSILGSVITGLGWAWSKASPACSTPKPPTSWCSSSWPSCWCSAPAGLFGKEA